MILVIVWTSGVITEALKVDFSDVDISHAWRGWDPGFFDLLVLPLFAFMTVRFLAIVLAIVLVPPLSAIGTLLGRPWGLSHNVSLWKRVEPVDKIATALRRCADVQGAGWRHRPFELRCMARALKTVETAIMNVHRSSGHLPTRSHRRRQLKVHAGLVVSALRAAEARVDSHGNEALAELASMLVTVAERSAEGRIGALLDENRLAGLTPTRDWEPFRLAAAASLIAVAAVCVTLLHLPEAADAYVIGGCGVVILTVLYGPRAYQFLDVLAKVRGS
ncbi:hypothetical protein ABZ864_25340 [Streptomyces sp. NPDC047082]|uniref:hypothetical protein n=1 Tax=Streptomyces sp. NPDC047082 TaxID=3155259 RepID=UPI0033D98BF7